MNADLTSAATSDRKTDALLKLGIIKKIRSMLVFFSVILLDMYQGERC